MKPHLDLQLMKDAPMVIVTYKADPAAIQEILPPGLSPHPEGRVVLNMWDQDDAGSSSGFGSPGPVSVTYLAIEVAGHDTWTADGSVSAPGRYFAGQWISSEDKGGFAQFGRQSAGVESHVGDTRYHRNGSRLLADLTVDGQECIKLEAEVGDAKLVTVGGHLNYFCDRNGASGVREIARVGVPFVFDIFEAAITSIRFDPAASFRLLGGAPAAALAPLAPLDIGSVMYGKATWAPFQVAETWPAAR